MKNFQNKLVNKDVKQTLNQPPLVEEYMTRDLITFKKDTDINVVIKSLLDNRISGAPVLDDNGQVVGLIDDKDCLNILFGNVYNRLPTTTDTVSNYMSNVMKSISVNQTILDVASVFLLVDELAVGAYMWKDANWSFTAMVSDSNGWSSGASAGPER